MSSVEAIFAKLEELSAKVGYLQADVRALRQGVDGDRKEYRQEITSLRSDLALFVNRANVEIDEAKKKAIVTQTPSKTSSPKQPEPKQLLRNSIISWIQTRQTAASGLSQSPKQTPGD